MSSARRPTPQQQAIIDHDAHAPLVVVAGAGSGKTATLVDRIHHLVCECGVDPRTILAVTFSRSAAGELSARLFARLGTRAEDLTVSTFHAFCHQVLLRHAYYTQVDPDLVVLEESEALTRFAAVFRELLDGRIAVQLPRILDLLAAGATMAQLYRLVTTITEEGLDPSALLGACRRAHAHLLPANGAPEPLRIEGALATGFYRRAGHGWSAGDPKPEEAFARGNEAPSRAALEAQLGDEQRVVRVVAALMERFDALLAERGEVTYAHLIAQLDRLLDDPEQRAAIRGRYAHCVVDEYQDTNRAQQRLIERIFGDELHGVMLVGDPRQSIYGFRNARPEEIERLAVRHASAGIDDNFRSLQPILDAAQRAIGVQRPGDAPLRQRREEESDGEQIAVFVTPSVSRPTAQARELEAAAIAREIERLVAQHGLRYRDVVILLRRKAHAHVYVEALGTRGIPARTTGGVGFYDAREVEESIAWLRFADDPTDDAALLRVLRSGIIGVNEATIAALVPSDGSEGASPQTRRIRFARAVLLGPLPDEVPPSARGRLGRLRAIADELDGVVALPLAEAISRVLRASGLEQLYASQAETSLQSHQALANLRRLEQIAQDFVRGTPDARIPDFLLHLDALREVAFDEREADPPAADAVTIATIHWAKGREWPAVFVADTSPRVFPGSRRPDDILWDHAERTLIVTRDDDGAPSYHALRARFGIGGDAQRDVWAQRELDEEVRLFYVALTRARDRLYVCGTVPVATDGNEKPSPFLAEIRAMESARTCIVTAGE